MLAESSSSPGPALPRLTSVSSPSPVSTYLVDVVASLGAGLHVGHLPLVGALAARGERHAPLLRQVGLVADQEERNVLVALHAQDLLSERPWGTC